MSKKNQNALNSHLERATIELGYAFLEASTNEVGHLDAQERSLAALIAQSQHLVDQAVELVKKSKDKLVAPDA